jgi:hypothetical protein
MNHTGMNLGLVFGNWELFLSLLSLVFGVRLSNALRSLGLIIFLQLTM